MWRGYVNETRADKQADRRQEKDNNNNNNGLLKYIYIVALHLQIERK